MRKRKQSSKTSALALPDAYKPRAPEELIGPARTIARRLVAHARKIKGNRNATLKQMLHGSWGNGKTRIAKMVARVLIANEIDMESINGKNVTIDVVREWQFGARYSSLFGGWKAKLINEVDLMPQFAQELMLTYLDELPPQTAVIATSNATLDTLTDRFVTRFSPLLVKDPSQDEIAEWLCGHWRIPAKTAQFIALGACGNVRDALLRARGFLIHGRAVDRPGRTVIVKDPARTAAAKKAWATMRARQNGGNGKEA